MPTTGTRITHLAASTAVLAPLAPASVAHAHDSRGWYWSERNTDRRLLSSYGDSASSDCVGWGPTTVTRRGQVKYSHFSCSVELEDGTGMLPTVEVLGRRKARVLYDDASDVIR